MKTKIIPNGCHMAINDFTYPRKGGLKKTITFTPSCRYDVGVEQLDWNKLCGMSFGFFPLIKQWQMHENSARFGWRYNPATDYIEVSPYLYDKGVRKYAEILGIPFASLAIGIPYEFYILPWEDGCSYVILDGEAPVYNQKIIQYVPSEWGFNAPLFFGGNATPNHTIFIHEE